MVDTHGNIQGDLLADLEALRPILEQQGVVQFRQGCDRAGAYRIRFREFNSDAGFTLHRSLSLGRDPITAEAVTALILTWQEEFQSRNKAVDCPPAKSAPETPPPDPARDVAQALCGGGWRRREQIGKWFDDALQDPAEMLRFAFSGKFPAPRKAGRPPKKRLW